MVDQQSAQQRLLERGILNAAIKAGWKPATDGWYIPIYQLSGQPMPKRAWKAFDSSVVPKYRIPYKKHECQIYALPGIAEEIYLAAGELHIAGGFVDLLTLHEAGIKNSISFIRENSLPDNFLEILQGWGVKVVISYPHHDPTGRLASQKIKTTLMNSGINFKAHQLPPGLGTTGDLNDLWRFVGFKQDLFKLLLAYSDVLDLSELPEPKTSPDTSHITSSDSAQVTDAAKQHYGEIALADELDKIQAAPKGFRNEQLNRSTFKLGQLIAAETLERSKVESEVRAAALTVGLSEREVAYTIKSGLDAGIANPRDIKFYPKARKKPTTPIQELETANYTATTKGLPQAAREKLSRLSFQTSRGPVPGAALARLLEIMFANWQPGTHFTATDVIQLCQTFGIGKSHIYAMLGLYQDTFSPESALFILVGLESHEFGEKACRPSNLYQMPTVEQVCRWLEVIPDLLPEPDIPTEALASTKTYRQAVYEMYLRKEKDVTEATSQIAQRFGLTANTIWLYEREIGERLKKEARYDRQRITSEDDLPDEITAYREGLYLENRAGVIGKVTPENYQLAIKQTGAVYLVRRLASRRIYMKPEEPDPGNGSQKSEVVYCQFCGQQHHLAFGQPPRECQTCRDIYGKTGKAYWGSEPPPVGPDDLRKPGKPNYQ